MDPRINATITRLRIEEMVRATERTRRARLTPRPITTRLPRTKGESA
jgi:hypothetical protein